MAWEKVQIKLEDGNMVEAIAPVIISASRATDVPAFHFEWFMDQIKRGYLTWTNPFNRTAQYISFDKARLIVFWTKNPRPIFKYLDFFDSKFGNYYFQYTVNDYEDESLEPGLPKLSERIETFIELSNRIGKERVIWRFDPLILTDEITINSLIEKIRNIGNGLKNYTDRMVFSFVDVERYRKVKNNLVKNNIKYREFNTSEKIDFAQRVSKLGKGWGIEIATCSEDIDLEEFGISHNKCIDDDLIIRLFNHDKDLMNFLSVEISQPTLLDKDVSFKKTRDNKDKGQRKDCGCIVSKDIGEYGTCGYACKYCYANNFPKTKPFNF